ncbi:hypothetical protein BDA96_02G148100 [Sorghum bicolor]|uniref:Uncharacterized protein n=2 Tax=Sorghum bicolor TaxID=4558 RepID=A0A1W0W3V1_SORBI|nr:hypothetical protein BDA96_02G148100 [Sorghum bicolor]OQU89068.1 hypothetical protein SORBI_3002G142350 [Sorghum bicolor]
MFSLPLSVFHSSVALMLHGHKLASHPNICLHHPLHVKCHNIISSDGTNAGKAKASAPWAEEVGERLLSH